MKNKYRQIVRWLGLCSILSILSVLPSLILDSVVMAADVSSCISTSGASSVGSINYACNGCFSGGSGGRRGTLWFNDGSAKDSDVVNVTSSTGSAPIVMWGQVYSCRQSGAFSNTAHYIWFGEAGHMENTDEHLTFLNFGPTLSRGSGSGAHTWSSGGNIAGTVDIDGFKSGATCTPEADGTETCTRVVSVNRCYADFGGYNYDGSNCYGDDSTIVLKIGTPPPSVGSATAYFESDSTINVGSNIDNGGADITTARDGYRDVEFSTDNDTTTVTFKHNIYYLTNTFGSSFDSTKDQFTTSGSAGDTNAGSGITDIGNTDDIYTPYYITTTVDGTSTTSSTTNTSKYNTSDGSQEVYNESSYSIYVPEGSQKTVCSSVTYTQKTAFLGKSKHITTHAAAAVPGTPAVTDPVTGAIITPATPGAAAVSEVSHYDYYLDHYDGVNGSEVCVTVVHPEKPGGNPKNPNASGTPVANVMFAGEDTRLAWDINAKGVSTRRLQERSVIGYLVPVNVAANTSSAYTGSYGTSSNPCAHYGSISSQCYAFASEGNAWSDAEVTDTYNNELSVKVPNEVGYKYCNSAGYKFQYWFAIDGSWQADTRSGKTYWFNFAGSCRTIAKKPTAAIWNGGIFTSGGIKTSIAKRFNTINFGDTTSTAPTDQTTFGSWSEFLTVADKAVGDTARGFASGSVFYKGTGNSLRDSYPLTISNTDTDNPGRSGIGINSTLRTRLEAYLKNRASGIGNTISGLSNVTGTQIYSVSGDLKIDGNITTAAGLYTSIYDIPQVVIFVDGKVNISSDVTRIDAWIIATGEINTCSSFVTGVTGGTQGTSSDSGQWPYFGDTCANQLIFNGPVMANNLKLNRSFGSAPHLSRVGVAPTNSTTNSSREAPAEIFNLRADTYLWAYAQSTRYDSSFTETYSRELAPRY